MGIVEKAQETRFGMSTKYSRYIGMSILESCFVSYVIVKSPSKPYTVVHSHTALLHECLLTIALVHSVSVLYSYMLC